MKKILFSLAFLTGFSASAQLPDGSIAPDFTLTDIQGHSHNLYTYLNQGKTVFIDVSATWCGPCWGFHETHALDNLWTNHGPSGAPGVSSNTTNDVVVIYIEGDGTTNTMDLHGLSTDTQGDWVSGVDHPIIDPNATTINTFNDNYAIGYFPTIYKICPNRVIMEVGQMTAAQLYASVSSCPDPASAPKDALFSNYSASTSICTPMDYVPQVKIQNNGLLPLTDATILVKQNGTVISTGTYSGNLATYAIATVNCSQIDDFNGGSISIEVVVEGDANAGNNVSSIMINPSIQVTNIISLEITTDGYASETSWNIKNANNTVVPGTTDPTLANNTDYSFDYTLLSTGCYTFNITDSYGDGITPGTISVTDSEGQMLFNEDAFGSGATVAFNVIHVIGSPTVSSSIASTNNTIQLCAGASVTLTSSSPSGNLWSNGETTRTIVVTQSGDYFVTAQSGNSDTISIMVNPALDMAANLVVESTCNGNTDGSVELTGTGTGDLMWNGNTEVGITLPYTVTNLGVGTYTFQLSDGMCSSQEISATINDLGATVPTISASGNLEFCEGMDVVLTASEASGITWSNGETTQSITVNTAGDYKVSFVDMNGCLGESASTMVTVNPVPVVGAGSDMNVCLGSSVALHGSGALTYTWDNGVTNGASFVFNGTTTYTVTGVDANGCENTAQVTLTGLSLPTVNGGADQTVCVGGTATLSASGADSYVWSGGVSDNTAFTVSSEMSYTVTGFATNGCYDSDIVSIMTHPVPQVSFSVPTQICKQSGAIVLTATPAGGVFSGNNGVSGNMFNPASLSANVYLIKYVSPADANGCVGEATDFIQVLNCLEVDEMANEGDLVLYPNPSNGEFTVTGADLLNYKEIRVIDNSGRTVSMLAVDKTEINVNLDEVSSGIYTLVFTGDNGTVNRKIQVNK